VSVSPAQTDIGSDYLWGLRRTGLLAALMLLHSLRRIFADWNSVTDEPSIATSLTIAITFIVGGAVGGGVLLGRLRAGTRNPALAIGIALVSVALMSIGMVKAGRPGPWTTTELEACAMLTVVLGLVSGLSTRFFRQRATRRRS
jgi:hypothetical protein